MKDLLVPVAVTSSSSWNSEYKTRITFNA